MNSHRNTQHTAFRLAGAAAIGMLIMACSNQATQVPDQAATPTSASTSASSAPAGTSLSNDLIINFPSPALSSPLSSPIARDLPAALPLPSGENATVTGVLVDARTGAPMANTIVRFAITRDETFIVDIANNPYAISDETGRFTVPDIKADTYVAVIGDPYNDYTFAPDLGKPSKIRIFDFKGGKINNLDVLIVDYNAVKPQ
jgi:hypothetical protein